MRAHGYIHRVHGCPAKTQPSSPAKAGDPVSQSVSDRTEKQRRTGSPLSRGRRIHRRSAAPSSRLLLHVLDAGKRDAFGAFADVAEIEFVLGQKHRIAIDVVG